MPPFGSIPSLFPALSLAAGAFAPSPLCRKHSPFESAGRSLGDDGAASGDGRGHGAQGRDGDLPGGDRGVSSSRGSNLDRDNGASSLGDGGARRGGGAAAGQHGRARRDRGAGGGQHLGWERRCGGRGGSGRKRVKFEKEGKVNFFGFFSRSRGRRRRFHLSLTLEKRKRKKQKGKDDACRCCRLPPSKPGSGPRPAQAGA